MGEEAMTWWETHVLEQLNSSLICKMGQTATLEDYFSQEMKHFI